MDSIFKDNVVLLEAVDRVDIFEASESDASDGLREVRVASRVPPRFTN